MAGEAQNKLGELFVDLGVGGVGKTLKALNTVSATFLLTKNTAQQLIKPIVEMGKQSLNSAVEIGKLSASFGTTLLEAQKFAYYLKENSLSEGLLSDMQNMQNKFTRIMAGFEGVDGQMAMSMNMLGLDWQNYDGSAASMMQYVKDVQNAVKGMDANTARMHLQNLGLGNNDWLYAFESGEFKLNDALKIDDETIRKQQEAAKQFNKLGIEIDQAKQKITKAILDKGGEKVLNNIVDAAEKSNTLGEFASNVAGKAATEAYKNAKEKADRYTKINLQGGRKLLKSKGYTDEQINDYIEGKPVKLKGKPTGGAAGIDLGYNPLSNLNSMPNQNIEITNQMTITGDNAQEIADKVASINSMQLQYNQYQSYNMAGV